MFKITAQLTNARPTKDETPMVSTTPTTGNMKLSESAASVIGVSTGDYLAVVTAETEEGDAFFVFAGQAGGEGEANVGSKLGNSNGKVGGSLEFSSANTWKQLGGNTTGDLKVRGQIPLEDRDTIQGIFLVPKGRLNTNP